ncbi:DUF6318 family protein [Cellulomonas sp. S1-8]|uniref:DUF6318 family protein n=1 Tax=Cellulomonas sp. S1-8 TaxID=2904790 RepID=UPI0022435693|nr:DUF6318 family protein [Cellulomonas sp. S1-8]UZN02776.1 DUF6318 family protein [Cellulomonas sp. S1-8]
MAPTPTPTAEPTPTPTPMAFPTPPALISEPTPEGAIAAGTQFVALYDYAFSALDAAPLLAMSAESCEVCTYVDDSVASLISNGETSVGEASVILTSRSTEIRPDEWFSVELRVQQAASQKLSDDGDVVGESAPTTADFVFAISWDGGAWTVEAVDILVVDE